MSIFRLYGHQLGGRRLTLIFLFYLRESASGFEAFAMHPYHVENTPLNNREGPSIWQGAFEPLTSATGMRSDRMLFIRRSLLRPSTSHHLVALLERVAFPRGCR